MCVCVCVSKYYLANHESQSYRPLKIMEPMFSWCCFSLHHKSWIILIFQGRKNNRDLCNPLYGEQLQRNHWLLWKRHSYPFEISTWIPTVLLRSWITFKKSLNLSTVSFLIFDFVLIVYAMVCTIIEWDMQYKYSALLGK